MGLMILWQVKLLFPSWIIHLEVDHAFFHSAKVIHTVKCMFIYPDFPIQVLEVNSLKHI